MAEFTSYGTQYNQAAASRLGGGLANAARAAGSGFGGVALDREEQQLREARAQGAAMQSRLATASGSPFAAARQASRALGQQTSAIQQQTDATLAQAAEQERQRQEAERIRREQQAQQWLGAGLSAAGSVLGNVLVPGIGGAAGGGLGGAIGSALTGGGGGQAGQPPMMVQPRAAVPAQPVPADERFGPYGNFRSMVGWHNDQATRYGRGL